MSGKVIRSAWLREDPFFEIASMPGRLYLEAFAFGDFDNPLGHLSAGGMDMRSPERSPLTLFPDPKKQGSSTLLRNLDRLRSSQIVYDVAAAFGSCSIGAEWKNGGSTETNTIYLFFKCDLTLLRLFGANNQFKVDFERVHRVGEFLTKRSW